MEHPETTNAHPHSWAAHIAAPIALLLLLFGYGFSRTLCGTPLDILPRALPWWLGALALLAIAAKISRPRSVPILIELGLPATLLVFATAYTTFTHVGLTRPTPGHIAEVDTPLEQRGSCSRQSRGPTVWSESVKERLAH